MKKLIREVINDSLTVIFKPDGSTTKAIIQDDVLLLVETSDDLIKHPEVRNQILTGMHNDIHKQMSIGNSRSPHFGEKQKMW